MNQDLTPGSTSFQQRVAPWMQACFGPEISADKMERNHRFFEEGTELIQANGMTRSEAHQLVDYTFDRPVGELRQEAGGVMVTLAALCLASGLDMHEAGEIELERIWTMVDAIRAKQAAKPKHSPLPVSQTVELTKCSLCQGKGWYYMANGYLPGQGEAPQIKVECSQCVAAVAQPVSTAPTHPATLGADAIPQSVLDALRFYANGEHLVIDGESQEFDTVSGEPQNWLMSLKDGDTTMMEDGSIARQALLGEKLQWIDGDEDHTPKAIKGEVFASLVSEEVTK